jgi:hypothetical protein
MIHSLRRAALGAGLVVAAALAGCSSSGNGASSSPAGATSAPGGTASTPGGGAPATANAATTKAITNAYEVFFDSRTTNAAAVAALQHGAKFRAAVVRESKSNYSKQRTTATVSAVRLQNPNIADVTFSIKVGGQTMLPNTHGFAVREDGKWKVAAQTFCNLLTLEGTAPATCKNASLTALPS